MLHHKSDPCMFDESVIALVNLINVTLVVKVRNLHSGIFSRRSCPHRHMGTQLHILVYRFGVKIISHCKMGRMNG